MLIQEEVESFCIPSVCLYSVEANDDCKIESFKGRKGLRNIDDTRSNSQILHSRLGTKKSRPFGRGGNVTDGGTPA